MELLQIGSYEFNLKKRAETLNGIAAKFDEMLHFMIHI